ncbi:hypothetical protein HMPREF9098_1745 [Kingella denitrificans ATCC 33394]|uniref:Uncharacterized protein n=1 Tax=Kingella denitrificans ATCC 33394 TaxID=888741 RepID=F0F0W0_9NEIS|nr:hypothetical protein HMPREF9098_1745 [Kingella denitrificans ATCC 33394]
MGGKSAGCFRAIKKQPALVVLYWPWRHVRAVCTLAFACYSELKSQ